MSVSFYGLMLEDDTTGKKTIIGKYQNQCQECEKYFSCTKRNDVEKISKEFDKLSTKFKGCGGLVYCKEMVKNKEV